MAATALTVTALENFQCSCGSVQLMLSSSEMFIGNYDLQFSNPLTKTVPTYPEHTMS